MPLTMPDQKEVYIVGGPNGSGKTTFVKQFLPNYANVRNFVNADDIAGEVKLVNRDYFDWFLNSIKVDKKW
jgi:predicted ABC-type ATPase